MSTDNFWHAGARDRAAPALVEDAVVRVRALARAVDFDEASTTHAVEVLRQVMDPWGDVPIGQTTGWLSDIADDNSPIEFSLCLHEGRAEIRMMIEAQGRGPTLLDQRQAGRELNQKLERDFGASLTRLRAIEALFLPDDPEGKFSIWHSVCFSPDKPASFKVYLNPWARGQQHGYSLIAQALDVLGFPRSWAALETQVCARGGELDQAKYFALDLADDDVARVKVYVHHLHPTLGLLENSFRLAPEHQPGQATEFIRALTGDAPELPTRFGTSHSFVSGPSARPTESSLYVPVCAYARDDATIRDRMANYLLGQGVAPTQYDAALAAFAHRPLNAGLGIHSYVAAGWRRGRLRATAYLSPEYLHTSAPVESVES